MDLSIIKKFAEQEHQRLKGYYHFENPQQMNLPITVKITEELGELCNETLAQSMGIDIELGLKNKMEKIESRYHPQS